MAAGCDERTLLRPRRSSPGGTTRVRERRSSEPCPAFSLATGMAPPPDAESWVDAALSVRSKRVVTVAVTAPAIDAAALVVDAAAPASSVRGLLPTVFASEHAVAKATGGSARDFCGDSILSVPSSRGSEPSRLCNPMTRGSGSNARSPSPPPYARRRAATPAFRRPPFAAAVVASHRAHALCTAGWPNGRTKPPVPAVNCGQSSEISFLLPNLFCYPKKWRRGRVV